MPLEEVLRWSDRAHPMGLTGQARNDISALVLCIRSPSPALSPRQRGSSLFVLALLCPLCLSLAAVCSESEYLGEVSVLQLVLETPGTIALQTSVDLLETGEVHLCLMAPVRFWSPLTQAVVII